MNCQPRSRHPPIRTSAGSAESGERPPAVSTMTGSDTTGTWKRPRSFLLAGSACSPTIPAPCTFAGMEFRVLGPLEVRVDGRGLELGGLRQRRVLATLLLSPNRTVSVSRLVEAAWDEDPPATARRQVQNRVAALRAILTRHAGFIDTTD